MSWHYLQGQEEASWEGICLDGAPSALLSLMPMRDESFLPDRLMEACHDSQSGTMSAPSTDGHGEVTSTSSAVDSHARTSALPVMEPGFVELDPPCGGRCTESFAKWDPSSSSWRTSQLWLTGDWTPFSDRWPTSGLMLGGACFRRQPLEHRISVIECGLWPSWPTPTVKGNYNRKGASKTSGDGLATAVKRMDPHSGGKLNPTWVEWLMGWPIGWTGLEPLETGRFQKWLEEHGRR